MAGNVSRVDSCGVDELPKQNSGTVKTATCEMGARDSLDSADDKYPLSNGSSLHGMRQPRQNLDHGHRAHTRPLSPTARNVNGNS